jgi:hypothetical protein
MATFEYLRISLAKSELPLFPPEEMTRGQFLRAVFSQRQDFTYRKRIYTYDPIDELGSEGDVLGGIIGREVKELRNTGPDADWLFKLESNWPFVYLAIDVSHAKQIAVVQRQNQVGSTLNLLQEMLDSATRDPRFEMWSPKVEYIASAQDFWKVAEEYAGRITSLKFVFVPPNMLRAKEAVDDLVRAASEEANAATTELQLKNGEGNLVPSGDLVEAAVSTATNGGGEAVMKVGKKTVYSSSMNRTTYEVDPDDMPEPSSIETIRNLFKKLLGK